MLENSTRAGTSGMTGGLIEPGLIPWRPINRLLRTLPDDELRQLLARAERVALRPRQVLHHWGLPMRDVYFIESGLVSVSVKIAPEKGVEAWLIGSEGMIGVPVLLGDAEHPAHRRLVQVGGHALRIGADDLRWAVHHLDQLRRTLERYVVFVLCQSSQWGACNAHHSLKQRTARWLLAASDCLQSGRMSITQQLLARVLGVRRAGITECMIDLTAIGAIRHWRGTVEIADRDCLEEVACECHRIAEHHYRKFMATQNLG